MKAWQRALMLPFASGATYTGKVQGIAVANLIAYWPQAEASGTTILDASGNGRNGTYTSVTLGATGIGDGRTAASYDGTASRGNIYSASLDGAFNNQEGTAAGWLQVSGAGVWTDATIRRVLTLQADANNRVLIQRTATDNVVSCSYIAGSTSKGISVTTAAQTTWLHIAITWSKAADQVKIYFNGTQSGATQTGLGVWSGALASANTAIGAAGSAGGSVWSGNLAHTAIWTTPLSAAQILALATV